jgi:hypothetical protein
MSLSHRACLGRAGAAADLLARYNFPQIPFPQKDLLM